MSFATAMHTEQADSRTENGARSYSTPDESIMRGLIKLMFKGVRNLSVGSLHKMLEESYDKTPAETIVLIFNLRHCRGGKGERQLGREALSWLMCKQPDLMPRLIRFIPEMGRWDDLVYLMTVTCTGANKQKVEEIKDQIAMYYMVNLDTQEQLMQEGKPTDLSAKWAPTEGDSMDKKHGVLARLCRVYGIHPKVYRTKYITPLRSYSNILESLMCHKKWNEIEFKKVPSCAMKRLKKAFDKHLPEEFAKFKADLESGKTTVKGKQLFPHELVEQCRLGKQDAITQGQWETVAAETDKLGNFHKTICVVDSSGSMTGTPMDVAFALGILVSSQTSHPFRDNVITFHDNPSFVSLKPNGSLNEKFQQLRMSGWGMSTNIQGTFDLMLAAATKAKLKAADMPDRIIIISDMQFNSCHGGNKTNWEVIERKYKDAGYKRPTIVFWNVRGDTEDFPVTTVSNDVCLVSGFSPSLLKGVIEMPVLSISGFVSQVITDPQYQELFDIARDITA